MSGVCYRYISEFSARHQTMILLHLSPQDCQEKCEDVEFSNWKIRRKKIKYSRPYFNLTEPKHIKCDNTQNAIKLCAFLSNRYRQLFSALAMSKTTPWDGTEVSSPHPL